MPVPGWMVVGSLNIARRLRGHSRVGGVKAPVGHTSTSARYPRRKTDKTRRIALTIQVQYPSFLRNR